MPMPMTSKDIFKNCNARSIPNGNKSKHTHTSIELERESEREERREERKKKTLNEHDKRKCRMSNMEIPNAIQQIHIVENFVRHEYYQNRRRFECERCTVAAGWRW